MAEHVNSQQETGGLLRWIVLFLTCAGLFGQFYAYDNPSALNKQLQIRCPSASYDYDFNLLYSAYSVPNIVLPLVLGVCMDRVGVRWLITCLAFFVVIGQVVTAIGVQNCAWPTMWAGRATFGIGGESMQIAQTVLLFKWFKGKEVALALGLNISVARAGSVLNDVLSPWTAAGLGLPAAFWLGAALCVLSCACNFACVIVDYKTRETGELSSGEETNMRDILKLPRLFWLLAAFGVIIYSGIVPFNNIASALFVENFYASLPLAAAQQQAGNVMSIMFLVSAVGTPLVGGLIDKIGRRVHMLIFAGALMTCTFMLMPVVRPAVSMLSLGVVYTVFAAALWPTYTLAVPEKQLGTAYGIATSLQNGGLATAPLIVAYLQSSASHFGAVLHFFVIVSLFGFLSALAIQAESRAKGVRLDLPSQEEEKQSLLPKHSKEKQ